MLSVTASLIDRLESAFNNLALAATNDTAVLQQLTAANLALTATVAALMAINKKLVDTAARGKPAKADGTLARAKCAISWKLLLDPRTLGQPAPHECTSRPAIVIPLMASPIQMQLGTVLMPTRPFWATLPNNART